MYFNIYITCNYVIILFFTPPILSINPIVAIFERSPRYLSRVYLTVKIILEGTHLLLTS